MLSPDIYTGGDNPGAALLPVFAVGLGRTTARPPGGGWGMVCHR